LDPLELALVCVWSFAVAVAGGVAGFVLGNLRLPVVLAFASSPAAGAGANVAISGVSALTSSVAHWRGGRIDWRLFWWMAPPSLVGGIVGGVISGALPKRVLLGVIAIVILYGAVEVMRERDRADEDRTVPEHPVATAVGISFAVGVLGGIVGLILGTLRLPALVKWLGVAPKAAVGTNAATGVAVAVGGVIGHLTSGVDWDLLAAGAVGAVPGAWIGAGMTGRLDDRALLRVVAVILVIAGISLGVQAALG
jgi:uncharacterized membrane protein YfcA